MNDQDHYAVFGYPIKHSKSPQIHQLFAEQTHQSLLYSAQEVKPEHFEKAIADFFSNGGKGLNCTLPLKELAWQYAKSNTERANLCKAVNTLVLKERGDILGDNTDGCGFMVDLTQNHSISVKNTRVLVLGAGGATRGILTPLLGHEPDYLLVANRTQQKAYDLAAEFKSSGDIKGCGFADLEHKQFDLIVNATSAGLYDEKIPLPENILADGGVCYDLAYANKPTAFVRWGLEHQARKSLDGLGMLVEQAAEAFFLWRNVRPNTQPVIQILNAQRELTST